ncbi:hypothetical protein M8J75_015338 [Diaphorina citri]|nr:hypothetical protein M8J75_015338 [Diaphorina citri]
MNPLSVSLNLFVLISLFCVKCGVSESIQFYDCWKPRNEFNTTKLIGQAHKAGLLQDLPLVGMDTDACKFTKCPVVAGVRQTYSYPMEIKAEYPEGAYTVKWKLWNENDPIVQSCCLKFNIVLI